MRKRETLIESKRYVNKFDYHLSTETFVQTVDSHIEALDIIDRLKVELEHAQAERDVLREYIRVVQLDLNPMDNLDTVREYFDNQDTSHLLEGATYEDPTNPA